VEEGWMFACIEGDCDHETEDDCVVPVVACAGCLESAEGDDEGIFTIPEWPCIHATHYGEPRTSELKAQLVTDWRRARS
jgi:hypothetical protein